MSIRVLIVDDEPLSREGLTLRLAKHQDITVVGEAGNGSEAIKLILSQQPDLVFLDINMPKVSGFDVVEAIGAEHMPAVIFLTAYDEFAVKAFQVNALDYLLKPINSELFSDSLQRARKAINNKNIEKNSQQLSALLNSLQATEELASELNIEDERMVIRSNGHVYFLKPDNIFWVEADGDYIKIHTDKERHMIRETMRNMEKKLENNGFQRIHRSSIVNVSCIRELISIDSGEYDVVLDNGQKLKLSRSYRDALFTKLKSDI